MSLERCCICGEETGRAGRAEDSIYLDNGAGPFCSECYPHYRLRVAAQDFLVAVTQGDFFDETDMQRIWGTATALEDALNEETDQRSEPEGGEGE